MLHRAAINNLIVDVKETTHLFKQLSVALQMGNTVSFQSMLTTSQCIAVIH